MATVTAELDYGVDEVPSTGQSILIDVLGTWAAGETWTIDYAAVRGNFSFGYVANEAGDMLADSLHTTRVNNFAMTLKDRVYVLSDYTLYFSGNENPRGFNIAYNDGANWIQMVNNFATPEKLVSLAPYQGRLAVFSRHTTQIWIYSSDPGEFSQAQVLPNVGTMAPLSVASLGELDVIFLSDSGIRSLRVRDSSLNAVTIDIGRPIDKEVKTLLTTQGVTPEDACAIVEPRSGNYWLFLYDRIYVLSYAPTARVVAWSTYKPTYESGGTTYTFTPEKFVVYEGKVYCRDTSGKIVYYSDEYDSCIPTAELPWLDMGKPGRTKISRSIDMASDGAWLVSASMDYREVDSIWTDVVETEIGSYNDGVYEYTATGTHIKLKAVGTAVAERKILGAITFNFNEGNDR